MSLEEKKQGLTRVEKGEMSSRESKREKRDPSSFERKKYLTKEKFIRSFKNPEFADTKIKREERTKIAKTLFERQDGPFVNEREAKKILKDLKREKHQAERRGNWTEVKATKNSIKLMEKFLEK